MTADERRRCREEAIAAERKAWARGLLIVAWGRVERLAQIGCFVPHPAAVAADRILLDANAIATEWGLDAGHIVKSWCEKQLLGGKG